MIKTLIHTIVTNYCLTTNNAIVNDEDIIKVFYLHCDIIISNFRVSQEYHVCSIGSPKGVGKTMSILEQLLTMGVYALCRVPLCTFAVSLALSEAKLLLWVHFLNLMKFKQKPAKAF